jgi:hypothetical protein
MRGRRALIESADFANPDAIREAVEIAAGDSSFELTGVVYLAGLGAARGEWASSAELREVERRVCGGALLTVQALAGLKNNKPPRLILATRGAQSVAEIGPTDLASSTLWGLARTIAMEHPEMRCRRIDLDPESDDADWGALIHEMWNEGGEEQVGFREGRRLVPRLAMSDLNRAEGASRRDREKAPLRLDTRERGILENLELKPLERRKPGRGEVEIRMEAAGLNFRDVLNALGMYAGGPVPFGGECAGVVSAVGEGMKDFSVGDEVITIAPGSLADHVVAPAQMTARKPKILGFERAAGIAIPFLTADHCLNTLAKLKAGERILIHSGAGGVGLAAIQLAQMAGAVIFATAGSRRKREYLKSLGVQHVLHSRTLDFRDEILGRLHRGERRRDVRDGPLRRDRSGGYLVIGENADRASESPILHSGLVRGHRGSPRRHRRGAAGLDRPLRLR